MVSFISCRRVRVAKVDTLELIRGIRISTTRFRLHFAMQVWNSMSFLIWLIPAVYWRSTWSQRDSSCAFSSSDAYSLARAAISGSSMSLTSKSSRARWYLSSNRPSPRGSSSRELVLTTYVPEPLRTSRTPFDTRLFTASLMVLRPTPNFSASSNSLGSFSPMATGSFNMYSIRESSIWEPRSFFPTFSN